MNRSETRPASPSARDEGSEASPPSPPSPQQLVHCVVTLAHRHVRLRVSELDTVGSLVALCRVKLHDKYPYEEFAGAVVGVRSARLDKDLSLSSLVGQDVQEGDILEARSYTVSATSSRDPQTELAASTTLLNSRLQSYERSIGVSARLGSFTVTPLQAEGLTTGAGFRSPRVSLTVSLAPYEPQTFVPPATGPAFIWPDVSVVLKHSDPTKRGVYVLLRVFDESVLGRKACIAMAAVPLQDAVSAPGVSKVGWVSMDSVGDSTGQIHGGRIRLGVSFHPKVVQGPTIHHLLQGLRSEAQQSPTGRDVQRLGENSVSVSSSRNKPKKGKLHTLPPESSKQTVKGHLRLALRSLHLCSTRCSSVHGHSATQTSDFHPIVRVSFADFVHELHLDLRDCNDISFEHEWPVHSSYSLVELELLRKTTVGGATHKLVDGSSVALVCSMSMPCHGVQVLQAAELTVDPPRPVLGPGGASPEKGFRWVPLHQVDEECGLAQVLLEYKDDYAAIVDAVEGPDVSFVPIDEREFDPAVVQRNIERLDELFLVLKAVQLWTAETLDWKYPLRTLAVWSLATFMCLHTPAGDLPLCFMTAFVVFLVATLRRFRSGGVHKTWVEERPSSCRRGEFRPAATLRVVPVSAKGLTVPNGSPTPPDAFVRVFYEPNYKDIPVQLIAQTECSKKSESPIWALAQPESKSTEPFRAMNARWLKDKARSLSCYEQDVVLQDIVQPWPRADGHVDSHAFRYRLLQAAQVNARTSAEELIPWLQSPGAVRFDVMQDNGSSPPSLLGRARVAIKTLVSDEKTGGPQAEQEQALVLATPVRSSSTSPGTRRGSTWTNVASEEGALTVVARMQLVLRDPKTRVTLAEAVESEALYSMVEMEHEKELSLVAKYHKAKDVAKNIQQTLGAFCSAMERAKNLLLWVHPFKTLLVLAMALVACLGLWLVPFHYLLALSVAKRFTQKFHKMVDTDMIRLQNLLCSIPNDLEMRKVFYWRNQEFLKRAEHKELSEKLQADWSGHLWKSDGIFHSWKERYCVVRGGRLEFWESGGDAKAGCPPKGTMVLANTVGECSKAESSHIPHDWYPVVLFDVSRRYLPSSPRRRVLCAHSKEERDKLVRVVHASGEALPVSRQSIGREKE